jgi:valyl-tRNA synthetase
MRRTTHAIRGLRAEQGIPADVHIQVQLQVRAWPETVTAMVPVLARLVRAERVEVEPFAEEWTSSETGAAAIDDDYRVAIHLSAADTDKEQRRVAEQLGRKRARLEHVRQRLTDSAFVSNAPTKVVEGVRGELTSLEREVTDLHARCEVLRAQPGRAKGGLTQG